MKYSLKYLILTGVLLLAFFVMYARNNNNNAAPYDVLEIDEALTHEECDEVMLYFKDKLVDSTVVGQSGFDKSADRTSTQSWLYKNNNDLKHISTKLYSLASKLTGLDDINLFEDIQVARYLESQEYKPHYDACVTDRYCQSPHKVYRKATLLVYLNDSFTGGETAFPLIDKHVIPKKGKAVFFFNTNRRHTEIHEALHGGLPVTSGEKWIANVWIKFK
jgi:prolyl 4-hydroxylase